MTESGRVTIFSIDNCPFCIKSKTLLKKKGIDYYEINLTDYPQKRPDMLKAAKELTVPQIFFNDKHIGGASHILALEDEGKLDKELEETLKGPGPTSPFLERPDVPPAPKPVASPRSDESIQVGGEAKELAPAQVVRIVESKLGKKFKGSALVDFAMKEWSLSKDQATTVGAKLLKFGFFASKTASDSDFSSTENYVLLRAESPHHLNTMRKWMDRVDEPVLLSVLLKKQLGNVISKHRDGEGLVDYVAASKDPAFYDFEEATCELQAIDLENMDADTKIAFTINIYNIAISHAFAKVGAPVGPLQRKTFFPNVGYVIGGHFYSFDAIESGILRANSPHPSGALVLKKGDPRLKCILPQVEKRIHFALNCGSKSCPSIKKFSKEAIHEELDLVAQSFFQQEDNFSIDGNTIHLNKILSWYGADFGKNKVEVAKTITQWLSPEQADRVNKIVDSGKLSIKFNHYDWGTDAKRTHKVPSSCVIC